MSVTRLLLLCLAHFLVDTLASFPTPIMPVLENRLQVSGAAIGMLATCQILAASFSQPFWGSWSDRDGRGLLLLAGPLVALLMLSLIGLTVSYPLVLCLIVGSAFGVAAFHPEATAHAGAASGQKQAAGVALFVISGHLGLGAGPMLAGWLVETRGLGASWMLLPPGLVLVGIVVWGLYGSRPPRRRTQPLSISAAWGTHRAVMMPLLALSTLRAFVGIALSFGLPFWWSHLGFDTGAIGLLSGIFLFAGGFSGFLCGLIARPRHEKCWILWTFVLTLPALWWLSQQSTFAGMVPAVVLLGATLNATIPMVLVAAQREMVGGESAAASLILGVAWGLGGALAPPLMRLAQEHLGFGPAMLLIGVGIIGALGATLPLPAIDKAAP